MNIRSFPQLQLHHCVIVSTCTDRLINEIHREVLKNGIYPDIDFIMNAKMYALYCSLDHISDDDAKNPLLLTAKTLYNVKKNELYESHAKKYIKQSKKFMEQVRNNTPAKEYIIEKLNATNVCKECLSSKKKCGVCEQVFYCSKKCQQDDWPQHKTRCPLILILLSANNHFETLPFKIKAEMHIMQNKFTRLLCDQFISYESVLDHVECLSRHLAEMEKEYDLKHNINYTLYKKLIMSLRKKLRELSQYNLNTDKDYVLYNTSTTLLTIESRCHCNE